MFPNKLQEHRKKAGMSQSDLAFAAGVSLRTLQDYEQCRKDLGAAAARTVLRLADILGVSVREIID